MLYEKIMIWDKFGLILNWVCLTWDQFVDDEEIKGKPWEIIYLRDLVDMESFADIINCKII